MPFNFRAAATSLSGNTSPRESKALIGGVISGATLVGGGAIAAFAGASASAAAYAVMGGLCITATVGLYRCGKALYDGCVAGRHPVDVEAGERAPLLSSEQSPPLRATSQGDSRSTSLSPEQPLSPRLAPLSSSSRDVPPTPRFPLG
jgi:hypothetical protein